MAFRITRVDHSRLEDLYTIPIAFEVRSIYEVTDANELIERPLTTPYIKDYDQLDSDPLPTETSYYCIFLAVDVAQNDQIIGGAILVMPEGELNDLRVATAYRRLGVGRALINHVIDWLRNQGTPRRLSIETQNINVAACRFYAAMGAKLGSVDRMAYGNVDECKHEIRLNWYVDLD